MPPFFFCSILALVFLYKKPRLSYQIPHNIEVPQVDVSLCDWPLRRQNAVLNGVPSRWYSPYSNCHCCRVICTYILSWHFIFTLTLSVGKFCFRDYCSLFIVHYSLLIVNCTLFIIHYSLFIVHCPLFIPTQTVVYKSPRSWRWESVGFYNSFVGCLSGCIWRGTCG